MAPRTANKLTHALRAPAAMPTQNVPKRPQRRSPLITRRPCLHTTALHASHGQTLKNLSCVQHYAQAHAVIHPAATLAKLGIRYRLRTGYTIATRAQQAGRTTLRHTINVCLATRASHLQPLLFLRQQSRHLQPHPAGQKIGFIQLIYAPSNTRQHALPSLYDRTLYDPEFPAQPPTQRFILTHVTIFTQNFS